MNDAETYIGEDERRYVSPTLSRDEQLGFIDTLRDIMGRNTAEINTQTERLGTDIPSNLGGLTGADSYFTQRYQTAPLESEVSALKSTAQAKALNDLLKNYESQMKNRAQQSYRRAQRRANPSSPNNPSSPDDPSTNDEGTVDFEDTTRDQSAPLRVEWNEDTPHLRTIVWDGYTYSTDDNGKLYATDDPSYVKGNDNRYHKMTQAQQQRQNMTGLEKALVDSIKSGATGLLGGMR